MGKIQVHHRRLIGHVKEEKTTNTIENDDNRPKRIIFVEDIAIIGRQINRMSPIFNPSCLYFEGARRFLPFRMLPVPIVARSASVPDDRIRIGDGDLILEIPEINSTGLLPCAKLCSVL